MSESNQYATSKVEARDFISGWAVALIITGTGVSLPILYLGSEISLGLGFADSLLAFGLSTVVLSLLCIATTLIGNRSRLSTYMILRFPFGKEGAKLINLIFGISLLGWFSVALELLAKAVKDIAYETLAVELPLWPIILITGALITITTMYGISSIEKLANIAVPLLMAFLVYAVYVSFQGADTPPSLWGFDPSERKISLFEAISALIGSSILVPVLMADFSRFIYNDDQSLIAVLGVGIGFPLVLVISAITAINTGEIDIILMMNSLGLALPAFLILFVTTWFTNATNLYSTSLTFSTVYEKLGFQGICILTSLLGIILALLGFSDYLFEFLSILGVFSPSVAAIYLIDFFWIRKQQYKLDQVSNWGWKGIISWGMSSAITLCTYLGFFQLTHAYFVDSFLIALGLYLILNRKAIKKGA